MSDRVKDSQVAIGGSKIIGSKNKTTDNEYNTEVIVKLARKQSAIVGGIVGLITSILGSYLYDKFLK